jgi:flagellar hook-basal body complex protein FliE
MTDIPTMVITPSAAARAYARVDGGAVATGESNAFGATLQHALEGAMKTGHEADSQAMQALAGGGNLTDVVTALSRAELTLQSATAIRDRVVQAYQDIMKMPI